MSSKVSLLTKFLAKLPARIFDSFMGCPLMFCMTCLPRKLLDTFAAKVFDSFIECPVVFGKTFLIKKVFLCLARFPYKGI